MLNKSTKGQRALIELYESIADLLPPTPPSAWAAWIKLGRQEKQKFNK